MCICTLSNSTERVLSLKDTTEWVTFMCAAYPRLCLPILSAWHYTSHTVKLLTVFSCSFGCKSSSGGAVWRQRRQPEQKVLQERVGFYSDNMCTGKCSRCVAVALYPLAVISIICNIVLFFPGGEVKYAENGHITQEVKYMGGLIGGGLMVSCRHVWYDNKLLFIPLRMVVMSPFLSLSFVYCMMSLWDILKWVWRFSQYDWRLSSAKHPKGFAHKTF